MKHIDKNFINITKENYIKNISNILSYLYDNLDHQIFQIGYDWSNKYIRRKLFFIFKSKFTPKKYIKIKKEEVTFTYLLHRLNITCKRMINYLPSQYIIKRKHGSSLYIDLDQDKKIIFILGWITTILQTLNKILKKIFTENTVYDTSDIVKNYKNIFILFFKKIKHE